MSTPSTYYLIAADGSFQPVVWDGLTPFPLRPGQSISATSPFVPAPTEEPAETPEARIARIQSDTDTLYESLPIEVQGMFLPVYAGVKDAILRGKFAQARAAVSAQAVPPELEGAKAAILAAIPAGE